MVINCLIWSVYNCGLFILHTASSNEFPVTITSNVTLHGIVCYNQSIELTCHAYGINVTMYKWMSSTGKFIQYYASIIVTVTDDLVEYTYTVTDNRGDHGYSSIDILSNGKSYD